MDIEDITKEDVAAAVAKDGWVKELAENHLKIYPLGSDSLPVKFAKIDNPEDDLPFFLLKRIQLYIFNLVYNERNKIYTSA